MNIKGFLSWGLVTFLWNQDVLGSDQEQILIVGCRPWDVNIQGIAEIENASFLDFFPHEAPETLPANFHHRDINDTDLYGAGKLSDFSVQHAQHFKEIIIDWFTYMHVRRASAWADFATLLAPQGKLVIPVTNKAVSTNESLSYETAESLAQESLAFFFNKIDLYSYDTMPDLKGIGLLRRQADQDQRIAHAALTFIPTIIVAEK
jgi:hypothetical protein